LTVSARSRKCTGCTSAVTFSHEICYVEKRAVTVVLEKSRVNIKEGAFNAVLVCPLPTGVLPWGL